MTFPTGVINITKCSDEELKTMLDEAGDAEADVIYISFIVSVQYIEY